MKNLLIIGAGQYGMVRRGLCLPSDNKMTEAEQDAIIEIIHRCFR